MTKVDRLKRRNLILGGLSVALVLFLVFRPAETSAVKKEALPALFPALKLEDVRQIQIKRASSAGTAALQATANPDDVVISRDGESGWTLASSNGYPASREKVVAFLESLMGAKRKGLVTTREETFKDYANDDGWIVVDVQGVGGKSLAAFSLGKSARWSEPYVKVEEGGAEVVVNAWNLASDKVRLTLDAWAEVALWPGLTLPDVREITVFQREEKGTLSFVREERTVPPAEEGQEPTKESGWAMRAPEAKDAEKYKVDNLARAFTGMRIQGVAGRAAGEAADEEFGLRLSAYRVVVKGAPPAEGGEAPIHQIKIGKQVPSTEGDEAPSDAWYLRRGSEDWVFVVSGASVADFREPAESYVPHTEASGTEASETEEPGSVENSPPPDEAAPGDGTGSPDGSPDGDADPDAPLPPVAPPVPPDDPQDEPKDE